MRIDRSSIAGHRLDVRLTLGRVASDRRWCPDVRVSLVKDAPRGVSDAADRERSRGVDVTESDAAGRPLAARAADGQCGARGVSA